MQGKPVKFIAVAANKSLAEALQYQQQTGLAMTIFPDPLGLMQARYGFRISLQNIWQYRIINGEGRVVANAMSKEAIEAAITSSKAEAKYVESGLDAKVAPVAELLEFGQFAAGGKQLATLRRSNNKSVQQSANKVYDALKKEAAARKSEAADLAKTDPIAARDLYADIAAALPNDDLGRDAQKALANLANNKSVKAEFAARTAFQKACQSLNNALPAQKPALAKAFQDLAKKHAGTPSAEKALVLAKELSADGKK